MARDREKIAWLAGWTLGAFWHLVAGFALIAWQLSVQAAIVFLIWGLTTYMIFGHPPWRHPDRTMWKMSVPIVILITLNTAWVFWVFTTLDRADVSPLHYVMLYVYLFPMWATRYRTWNDGPPAAPAIYEAEPVPADKESTPAENEDCNQDESP